MRAVVDAAVAANIKTLLVTLDAAGLAAALKAPGPFTVFAPTDEAFAALPEGMLQALVRPENRAKLRAIFPHHWVPGRLFSYEVANIEVPQMARTANGGRDSISADARGFRFVAAIEASGADQDWAAESSAGNWTVFVPTNDAFARLSEAERAQLVDPANRAALRELLDWHARPERQA